MKPGLRSWSIWYLLGGLALLLALQSLLRAPHRQTVPYSEFKTLLRSGLVRDVAVDGQSITGMIPVDSLEGVVPAERAEVLRKGAVDGWHAFVTVRVDDPQLVADLEAAGVSYSGRYQSTWTSRLAAWLLPAALFIGIWMLMARRLSPHGGLSSVGKSRAKVWMERSTGVTFKDVAGIDEARAELEEIVEFLENPDRFQRLGGKIPRGALLVGPPGVGKTLLAKAVAGEAGVPFFSLSASGFVEMFVGVGAARVRDLFAQAQAVAPSIIFIDELDALGRTRSAGVVPGGHDEREQTLNQLLAEMDGFDTAKGLIVMAATNRPEILDPALLRPGRFDRKITVDRPDLRGREQILAVHTRGVPLAPGTDLAGIAARTPGFSGADLANIVNEAALRAAREGKDAVDEAAFDEAIDRVVAGAERRSRVMNAREKGIVAFHEAGHALVAETRPHADRVAKISIIPRGVAALGYTRQDPTEDRFLMTRSELLDRLDVLLGGRVAEELVFGDVSTGAYDDLRKATDLVRHMITAWGMTDALGLASFQPPQRMAFFDGGAEAGSECSEETARRVDTEIRRLLQEAHGRVTNTLEAQRLRLEEVALLLMQTEVVTREALVALLSRTEARTGPGDVPPARKDTDPVCRMRIDEAAAVASLRHNGDNYLFCSDDCLKAFRRDPRRYAQDGMSASRSEGAGGAAPLTAAALAP